MLTIKVVGSAAGGGLPQWNCNFDYSRRARSGDPEVRPRLQSSIIATAGRGVVMFNASPDIRQQIAQTETLHPDVGGGLRSSPIQAVVLTNADVDHIAGLLSLRERQAFHLYATARVLAVLRDNSIFGVLDPAHVRRIEIGMDQAIEIEGPRGPTGVTVRLYPVPGKVALYLETGRTDDFGSGQGDTVGVEIRETGGAGMAHYVPGCAEVTDDLKGRVEGADLLLFDGTVFKDDEMSAAGVGEKTGRRMGHLPIAGPDGSMRALAAVKVARRAYVHINNTNPILDEASQERVDVESNGWDVTFDGMEFRI